MFHNFPKLDLYHLAINHIIEMRDKEKEEGKKNSYFAKKKFGEDDSELSFYNLLKQEDVAEYLSGKIKL